MQLREFPCPAGRTDRAGTAEGEDVRILHKAELSQALEALHRLFGEYADLLHDAWRDDAPTEAQRALLDGHRTQAIGADPFAQIGPLTALLRFVVAHLGPERLAFRLPARSQPVPEAENAALAELSEHLRGLNAALDGLNTVLYALARRRTASTSARVQRMLAPLAALFKGIVRQDWVDVEVLMTHLNMVTTSRESHELVEQVGRLVRSIYDSLNEISQDYPVESLSHVTSEIPDAVDKLGSVILELEHTANRNLDILEALSGQVSESRAQIEACRGVIGACEVELDALAGEHPEAAEALAPAREALAAGVLPRLEAHEANLACSHDIYMTLFASQSYQDLSGQTLKKVIAFIEGLQYQLIQVISKQSGTGALPAPDGGLQATLEEGPDARNRLSQEKVDSMLAEWGL